LKCRSIAFYGAEVLKLREIDPKYYECLEIRSSRRTLKISWTDHVRNEEVLRRFKGAKEHPTHNICKM